VANLASVTFSVHLLGECSVKGVSMPRHRPFRNPNARFEKLIVAYGGVFAMARHLGVYPSTLYRYRTGQWKLPADRAERMRAMALALADEFGRLAYELKQDAQAGRQRAYRAQCRRVSAMQLSRSIDK
jgi:hypothetical protein